MVKSIGLVDRPADHREQLLVPSIPGLTRVILCTPFDPGEDSDATDMWAFGSAFPWAGVIEAWSDDVDAAKAAHPLLADAAGASVQWMLAEEHVVVDGASEQDGSLVKVLFFPHKLPSLSTREFHRYWRDIHGALVPNTPGLHRYVQAHIFDAPANLEPGPPPDGVAELWWRSVGEMADALRSPAFMVEQAEDAANFVDLRFQTAFAATETRVL